MFDRRMELPQGGRETFFLWGPRQTGKSTLLRVAYADARSIDLLKSEEFARYVKNPELLREEVLATPKNKYFVIDEVQRVPGLLDEVHWLIENKRAAFVLCGSSARKLRRGHANLLGGRALRFELRGLVSAEVGASFDLDRALNQGYLPRHYLTDDAPAMLRAYVADYLREEVASEGLVRNLQSFARFLDAAALSDTEPVNASTIARDCGVSSKTVQDHFEILVDTMLGRWLPAYVKRPKRRTAATPKFYFSDVGVVNELAHRGPIQRGSELYGKAFENWVHHELVAHSHYSKQHYALAYWRLAGGQEVDFIIDDMRVAIEAKATPKAHLDHMKGLRTIVDDHPRIKKRIIVSLDPKPRRTEDGIDILPALEFAKRLWAGELF